MQPRTSGIAITALVMALAGVVIPVVLPATAMVLAIAAWQQIKHSNGRIVGRGLIAGTWVAAPIVLLVNALVIVALIGAVTGPDNEGAEQAAQAPGGFGQDAGPSGRIVAWNELRVGDCFLETTDDWAEELVPCSEPHVGEVIGVVDVKGSAYPTDDEFEALSAKECSRHFIDYVGLPPERAALGSSSFWPAQDAWDDGIHLVICYASSLGADDLEGSVKDGAASYGLRRAPSAQAAEREVHGVICSGSLGSVCPGPVRALAVGDCFSGTEYLGDSIAGVIAVDCDGRHRGEVFAVIRLRAEADAGRQRVERMGKIECGDRFERYTGTKPGSTDGTITYGYIVPTGASWASGHRHITCFIASSRRGADLYRSFRAPRP
jgi:Septum formation